MTPHSLLIVLVVIEVVNKNGLSCGTITVFETTNVTTKFSCPSNNAKVWYGPPGLVMYANSRGINKNLKKHRRLSLTMDGQLLVKNVSRVDKGLYRCVFIKKDFVRQRNFELIVLRKPIILSANKKIQTELKTVTNITVEIDAFPNPTVSWLTSAGGKIGSWIISSIGNGTFVLTSTIFPLEKNHFGIYTSLIRNSEGSVEVEFYLHGYEPSIYPDGGIKSCKTSSDVTLTCRIDDTLNRSWNSTWHHTRNTYPIRTLTGTFGSDTSVLKIKYCDYQDEGEYTCQWTHGGIVMSSSSMLLVNGVPIVTGKDVRNIKNGYAINVYFYSSTPPLQIEWYINDVRLGYESNVSMKRANVTLDCYGVSIVDIGYKAEYVMKVINKAMKVHCLIRNQYGNMVTQIPFDLTTSVSERSPTNRNDESLFRDKVNEQGERNPDKFLFVAVPIGAYLFIISFFSLAMVFWVRRGNTNLLVINNESDQLDTYVPNESNYEEIDNVVDESSNEQQNESLNQNPVYLDVLPDDSEPSTRSDVDDYMTTIEETQADNKSHHYKSLTRITKSMREKTRDCKPITELHALRKTI